MRAQIAQLVEQQTENLRVPSSILGLGTTEPLIQKKSEALFFLLIIENPITICDCSNLSPFAFFGSANT